MFKKLFSQNEDKIADDIALAVQNTFLTSVFSQRKSTSDFLDWNQNNSFLPSEEFCTDNYIIGYAQGCCTGMILFGYSNKSLSSDQFLLKCLYKIFRNHEIAFGQKLKDINYKIGIQQVNPEFVEGLTHGVALGHFVFGMGASLKKDTPLVAEAVDMARASSNVAQVSDKEIALHYRELTLDKRVRKFL